MPSPPEELPLPESLRKILRRLSQGEETARQTSWFAVGQIFDSVFRSKTAVPETGTCDRVGRISRPVARGFEPSVGLAGGVESANVVANNGRPIDASSRASIGARKRWNLFTSGIWIRLLTGNRTQGISSGLCGDCVVAGSTSGGAPAGVANDRGCVRVGSQLGIAANESRITDHPAEKRFDPANPTKEVSASAGRRRVPRRLAGGVAEVIRGHRQQPSRRILPGRRTAG